MTALEVFKPHQTPSGLYSAHPGGQSGNDILFSAEVLICLSTMLSENDFIMETKAVVRAIRKECETEDGLFARGNGYSQDQIGPDDLIGLGAISPFLAIECLDYLRSHWGYYKTGKNPHWLAPWMYRFPALIAHLNFAAGRKPNIFLRTAWCWSVAFGNRDDDQDSWILNSIMIYTTMQSRYLCGWPERAAIARYNSRLKSRWGSIRECLALYFGGPNAISSNFPEKFA